MKRIVEATMSPEEANRIIKAYPEDVVNIVRRCKSDMDEAEVFTIDDNNNIVDYPVDEEMYFIRKQYLEPALYDGFIQTPEEFDRLLAALDSLNAA